MRTMGSIGDKDYEDAKNTEVKVAPIKVDSSDAPISSTSFVRSC
jgi:hypothetical protein